MLKFIVTVMLVGGACFYAGRHVDDHQRVQGEAASVSSDISAACSTDAALCRQDGGGEQVLDISQITPLDGVSKRSVQSIAAWAKRSDPRPGMAACTAAGWPDSDAQCGAIAQVVGITIIRAAQGQSQQQVYAFR